LAVPGRLIIQILLIEILPIAAGMDNYVTDFTDDELVVVLL